MFLGALLDLEREEKEAFDNEVEDQKQKKKNKKLVERAKKKISTVAGPSTETDENELNSSDDSCLNLLMDGIDSENDWKFDKAGDSKNDWKLDRAGDSEIDWKLDRAGD